MSKTNAMRMLDRAGIPYTAKEYGIKDEDRLGMRVAELLDLPYGRVFKTLVLKGADYRVCCIPVDRELDLKKAAAAAGDKRLELLPPKELFRVTGYVRGGCSPIGMKKPYPVYIDKTALDWDSIAVSAGRPGLQIVLEPGRLMALVGAKAASLT